MLKISVFLAGMMALSVAGCNHVRPPIEPRNDPYATGQVFCDSEQLKSDIAVKPVVLTRDEAGLLHVLVPLRSVIDRQLHVQYRFTFFGAGRQMLNQTGWFDKTLTPNTPDQVTFNSTSGEASDFQMDLRYPPGY